jgi:hypothetical protein
MKYLSIMLFLLVSWGAVQAQESLRWGMNYQAVARNQDGEALTNRTISLQATFRLGAADGKVGYREVHRVNTGDAGLFNLVMGGGEVQGGDFSRLPWSTDQIWLEIGLDEDGGENYSSLGATQLLAVPYAYHALTAGSLAEEEGTEKTSPFWKANGNDLTIPGPHFLGTLDSKDLVFKTSNLERMRITAAGDVNIGNSLSVGIDIFTGRDAIIGRNVNVGNNANIANDLTAGGIARLNNTAQSTTKDNGTLIVEGGVGVEKNINVGGNSAVVGNSTVGGTLGVNGTATFSNTQESTTKDNGAVIVEGGVGIEKNLNVGGNSATAGNSTVGGTLTSAGKLTVNNITDLNGRVTVRASVGGGDDSYDAYPFRVEGSQQAMALKVDAETPNGNNNFITFFDKNNNARGRIEGQTSSEVASSPEYIVETAILSAEVVAGGVNIGLSALPNSCAGLGAVVCPPEPSVVAIAVADEVVAAANLAAYQAFAYANLGVTYQSGSADYAEWLERRMPAETMTPGDIVGVKGGLISKRTEDGASQLLVISTNPAVLGNMPAEGESARFEKVAFMGQIPVKVRGQVNIGDYILPSGYNDGVGRAVSPQQITPGEYRQIVGVAWSAAPAASRLAYVNMAIGLNNNEIASLVEKQQSEIEKLNQEVAALRNDFSSLNQRLAALESGKPMAPPAAEPQPLSHSAYIEGSMPVGIDAAQVEEAIMLLQDTYRARGYDINQHAGLYKLFNDQAYRREIIRNVQENYAKTRLQILEMERRRN